jgi:hypothetical protein|tara:strand:+ start:359 stop:745 length:387 start_codon:yes stop_codon:yes gene_type:complete
MSIKDNVIYYAFEVSSKMHGTTSEDVRNNRDRKGVNIKTKRLLIYYMHNYLGIKHYKMKKYFNNIHHATSIHHNKKFKFELNTYHQVRYDFDIFLKKMTNYSIYGHNFKEKINEIQQLLNELKTVIND